MGGSRFQPLRGIPKVDTSAYLHSTGISGQGVPGSPLIARTQHDDVAAAEPVPMIEPGIEFGRMITFEIRHQPAPMISQAAADDLLHAAVVKINAGPE